MGVFALVATVFGAGALLDMRNQQAVAHDFLETGVGTVADGVELTVRYGKGGSYIDTVEVTFAVATERHTRYAAPLQSGAARVGKSRRPQRSGDEGSGWDRRGDR
ncbi:hypothetical protein [Kribbella sp. NPDC048928]|uniref:hypothetical protein n=1 Tax=Kribbella sp. NPDC048928 TaxID=3364111 RepID=UPI00371EF166